MNTQAIGYVIMLAKQAKAKIVTNSAHNWEETETGDLKADLISWGMPEELFHDKWRTMYPWPDRRPLINAVDIPPHPRLEAINAWQKENGEADWVCFDDDPFTSDGRLIHTCDVMKCHGSFIIV